MDIQLLDHTVPDVPTPMETAKILHVGRSTMYHLLAGGKIRNFKIGTKILIPKSFLQDFIAKSSEIEYHRHNQMAEKPSCCKKERIMGTTTYRTLFFNSLESISKSYSMKYSKF